MSYARLYKIVQTQGDRISTRWLTERVKELSHITNVKEQWSGVIDATTVRGFYIEGPLGPPIPLKENECLIGLARSMCSGSGGDYWRRFVYTKELMHVFDEEDEKTDSPEKLDNQLEKFGDPKVGMTPQFYAELKAFWRAIGVLCTEARRVQLKHMLDAKEISFEVAATSLQIPPAYVRELMRDETPNIVAGLM